MNLPQLLQRLEELEKKATPGPWKDKGGSGLGLAEEDKTIASRILDEDRSFIAESRNALPQLLEFCREVLKFIDARKRKCHACYFENEGDECFCQDFMEDEERIYKNITSLAKGIKEDE